MTAEETKVPSDTKKTDVQTTKKLCSSINSDLIPLKIHFFAFCAAMGCFLPYLTIFMKEKMQMTATQVAVVSAAQQLIVIFTKPVIGSIVDYLNRLKLVIIILCVLQGFFFFMLVLIPPMEKIDVMAYNACCYTNISDGFNTQMEVPQNLSQSYCYLEHENSTAFPFDNISKTMSINRVFRAQDNGTLECEHNSNASHSECQNLLKDANDALMSTKFQQRNNATELKFPESCIDNSGMMITLTTNSETVSSRPLSWNYWLFVICSISGCISINGLFTLSDTACHETLQKHGSDYGKQRLWGSISWGIMAPLSGYLSDVVTVPGEPINYTPGFYLMLGFTALTVANIWRLDLGKPKMSGSVFKGVKEVFSSPQFVVFDFGVFMTGVFTSLLWFYLMIHMQNLGSTRLQMGLINAAQNFLGSTPMLFISGRLVQKIGHMNVLTLTLLAYAIRFTIYGYLKNPWFVLPVECLHGITYGLFYAAMTAFGKLSSRPGAEATTQSILCTTYEGLGAGLGCVVFGIAFDKLGSSSTFLVASLASFVGCCTYTTISMCLKKQTSKTLALNTKSIDNQI